MSSKFYGCIKKSMRNIFFLLVYIQNSINTDKTAVEDIALIEINIGNSVFDRYWKIKTSQIKCGDPNG